MQDEDVEQAVVVRRVGVTRMPPPKAGPLATATSIASVADALAVDGDA